jgi:hypothetical protein
MPFFRLLDAARQPGCVLCRLISTRTRRHIESVLYESVNDTGFRDQWRAARGFCHRHSWILAEFKDGLGTAILYEDVINHYGERLLTEGAGRGCPLCRAEAVDLDDRIAVIEQSWDDDELRGAIEAGDGLCGPHLRTVLRKARRADMRETFLKVSAAQLKQLAVELRQQIDSFDYQHTPPMDERIKYAWRRAIEQLVGCRDVPQAD